MYILEIIKAGTQILKGTISRSLAQDHLLIPMTTISLYMVSIDLACPE